MSKIRKILLNLYLRETKKVLFVGCLQIKLHLFVVIMIGSVQVLLDMRKRGARGKAGIQAMQQDATSKIVQQRDAGPKDLQQHDATSQDVQQREAATHAVKKHDATSQFVQHRGAAPQVVAQYPAGPSKLQKQLGM
jgi:hypothetical protein